MEFRLLEKGLVETLHSPRRMGTMSPILLTQIVNGEYFRVWIEGTKGEEHCVDKEKS